MSRLLRTVQRVVREIGLTLPGPEGATLSRMEILEASKGYLKQRYTICPEEDCNPMGNMHGGRIAAVVDSSTSLVAELTKPEKTTVTMDLSVSYLRGIDVSKEKTIIIESFVEHGGNKVFFTSCKFKNEDGSKTYAIGRQTQMMVPDPNALFKTSDFE